MWLWMTSAASSNFPKRIPLSVELKTHELILPCLDDTDGVSRNALMNTPRGVTVVAPVENTCW